MMHVLPYKKHILQEKLTNPKQEQNSAPIESEIDEMVDQLSGIEDKEEIILEELEEEVLVNNETEEELDFIINYDIKYSMG